MSRRVSSRSAHRRTRRSPTRSRPRSTAAVLPTREGGSGPEAALQQSIGAPLVFLGVGLPDDQIHAPNEKVTLSMLFRGAEAAALLWANFARLGRDGIGKETA